jgi:hypothetical protein
MCIYTDASGRPAPDPLEAVVTVKLVAMTGDADID